MTGYALQMKSDDVVATPATVEHVLAEAVAAMRALAARVGDDDYVEERARELLDRRPLVLLAVLQPTQTLCWAIEPSTHGIAIEYGACYLDEDDGARRILQTTEAGWKDYPLHSIEGELNWKVLQLTGGGFDGAAPAPKPPS